MTTATITHRGTDLAVKIHRMTKREVDYHLEQVCSLIARHSATYFRYQEGWCSSEWFDRHRDEMERKESRLEERITELAAEIGCEVTFQGDPRGYTVRLWPCDSVYSDSDVERYGDDVRQQSYNYIGGDS